MMTATRQTERTMRWSGVLLLIGLLVWHGGMSLRVAASTSGAAWHQHLDAALRVDPNVATHEALQRLPGVGEVLARRLIAWRRRHGPFTAASDLEHVAGIGQTLRRSLEPYLEFNHGAFVDGKSRTR